MTKPITRENTPVNQIAAMAERIEKLEGALSAFVEYCDALDLLTIQQLIDGAHLAQERELLEVARALLSSGDQG